VFQLFIKGEAKFLGFPFIQLENPLQAQNSQLDHVVIDANGLVDVID
jgi:hypothetical protein